MTEYRQTFSVRLLEDGGTFRITYWRPDVDVPYAGRTLVSGKSTRPAPPGYNPPMPRYRGRTICPTTNKLRYGTHDTARHALAQAVLSGNPRRREQRIYWCDDCDAYHLTSKS